MDIFNYIVVTLYGYIITLLFTKETKALRHAIGLCALFCASGIINLALYKSVSAQTLYMLYPLTVHLPLFIYFMLFLKSSFYETLFALTTAYMLTEPRKQLCELLSYALGGNTLAIVFSEIFVSAVLLFLIKKFLSPIVIRIFKSEKKEANYLCIIPTAIYLITYALTVYSDFLYRFPVITIPVLTSVLSVLFICFLLFFFEYICFNEDIRHGRELLNLQLMSAKKLIDYMDKSGTSLCQNKTVNAFLCMYQKEAKQKNIDFVCFSNLNETSGDISETAVIITSMLDDAMERANSRIEFEISQKNGQLCAMALSDAKGIYSPSMLGVLNSIAKKYGGMLYTDETSYKVQISVNIKL